MDHDTLKERTLKQQEERKGAYKVKKLGNEVEIDRLTLEIVEDFKDAFDEDKLAIRYTPLLAQYDYIVGDISAEQLRLKGFYNNNRAVNNHDKIQSLQDYLYEYANFGAPYFVLENINPRVPEVNERSKNKNKSKNHRPVTHKKESKAKVSAAKQKNKKSFVIKQK
ncbi:YutD family protein [Leuconostoc sp. JNUCC 76]